MDGCLKAILLFYVRFLPRRIALSTALHAELYPTTLLTYACLLAGCIGIDKGTPLLSACGHHDRTILVRRIYGKYKMDCGFGGKSTTIGIVDVKEVLSDFRYSAKLNFSPGVHKMTKSKMATNRSVTILKRLYLH